jgi:broad-specificity NMP kinase
MKSQHQLDRIWTPLLRVLNSKLSAVVSRRVSQQTLATPPDGEPLLTQFAGVYVDPSSILRLLANIDSDSDWQVGPILFLNELAPGSQWSLLASRLALSEFECGVLLLAFAAEIDSKYEKVFSYLQDDMSKKCPSLGLAFELMGGPHGSIDHRECFDVDGKLLLFALIEIQKDESPRLSWRFRLTPGAFRLLTEKRDLDPFLQQFSADASKASIEIGDLFHSEQFGPSGNSKLSRLKRLVVTGSRGVGKTSQIAAMSRELKLAFASIDLDLVVNADLENARLAGRVLAREAHLRPTLIHLTASSIDQLAAILGVTNTPPRQGNHESYAPLKSSRWNGGIVDLRRSLEDLPSSTVIAIETSVPYELACQVSRVSAEYHTVNVDIPPVYVRRAIWERELISNGWSTASATKEAQALAAAFRFGVGSIKSAMREAAYSDACCHSVWRASRARASGQMEGLAERIEPKATWTDLVVTTVEKEQLQDLARRVRYRDTVIDDWGFDRKLGHGKGVNALFAGPPGTGKTMAAEVLANELGIPLYRVDCSSVVSKYIGETEKNLECIFKAAQASDALVFFDEADSLFGKRTQVTDAHDRYANIETSYLLQRIERHEGIVVLATNLFSNIDSAFIRRVTQLIHFRQPDEASRGRIWKSIWPDPLPLSAEVRENLPLIARRFDVNGGAIKNAALTAAYLAADVGAEGADPVVQMEHVVAALAQEYRKLGRTAEKFEWRSAKISASPQNGGRA